MKVLHITTHFNVGGITNYILTLSDILQKKGIECIVVSSGGDREGELENRKVAHRKLNMKTKSELSPKVLKSIFALKKLIREEKIDLVHSHTRVSQVVSFFACKLAGVPHVTTCHGYFKKRLRKIFDTWGVKVIAISEPVREHLRHDLGVAEKRIELVYSGIDPKRHVKEYTEDEIKHLKQELKLKKGPIIGMIGRLSPVKGQEHLIRAMDYVVLKYPDAQCLLIGNGPDEKKLKELAKSLGLADTICFIDSVSDTHKYLSIMDVFVLPSIKEGLGIALLEALASGKASIASDIGGISDIIQDRVTGILVPVGDPGAIAEWIIELIDNARLRANLGRRGRELVTEKFTLDLMADGIIDVYKKILAERKR